MASAIILAVVAIVSEIAFFIVQTDRAAKSQREISDYVGQMRHVLGKIEGLTTSTGSRLETITAQMVSGLLGRAEPWPQAASAETRQIQSDPGGWRLQRAAAVLRGRPAARVVVEHLAGGARDVRDLGAQLFDLRPQTDEQRDPGEGIRWGLEIVAAMRVLDALELLARDEEANTVTLAPEGRDLGRLLAGGTHA